MSNHVTTIPLPRKIPTHPPTNTTMHSIVEDWVHTNKTRVEVKIHTGKMNVFIFLETGKYQYYRHLMKGTEKRKMDKGNGIL